MDIEAKSIVSELRALGGIIAVVAVGGVAE